MILICTPELTGAESFLPAIRLWTTCLCGEAHSYGDDEGCTGDGSVAVHGVSSARLYRQHHQANQQPLTAAHRGGHTEPGHEVHTTQTQPRQAINSLWIGKTSFPSSAAGLQ